jgi:alkylation response protein AidB-like acyl-CoA dehydrogenase
MSVIETRGEGSAERHEVVALARELGRRELAPHALELDERRPGALEAAWGRVTEVGFDRALLEVDDGGVGLDAGSLLLCLEEIAAGEAGVALLVLLANAALAALPPQRAAQVGEAERWALVPSPHGRISLGALGADGLVVVEAGAEPAVLALPAAEAGLKIEACEFQLGLRAAAAARVSLSAAAAGEAPSPAEAGAAASASLSLLRAGVAAIARGVARRAQEVALEYAQERVQGGVAIIEHDAVRRMLAAMSVRLAATPAPRGAELDEAAALAAKVAATEAAVATSTDAVQVFGGTGYMHETGVEKLMRDAKYLQLWPEPNWTADDAIVAAALGG